MIVFQLLSRLLGREKSQLLLLLAVIVRLILAAEDIIFGWSMRHALQSLFGLDVVVR